LAVNHDVVIIDVSLLTAFTTIWGFLGKAATMTGSPISLSVALTLIFAPLFIEGYMDKNGIGKVSSNFKFSHQSQEQHE